MKREVLRPQPKYISMNSMQSVGDRDEQQDYCTYHELYDYIECDTGCIAAVADGMGGYENGGAVAQIAAETFVDRYSTIPRDNVNMALIDSLNAANSAVQGMGGGSTLVCAAVKNWRLYWISVGDSRIYLYRNGLLRQLNIEHNYKQKLVKMVETGEIDVMSAQRHRKRNALTSYVGMEEITEYDYNDCEFPLLCGDKILLCTDGLYRAMKDSEIADAFAFDATACVETAVMRASGNRIRKQDNMTALVVSID